MNKLSLSPPRGCTIAPLWFMVCEIMFFFLMSGSYTAGFCLTTKQSTQLDRGDCHFSDRIYNDDLSLMRLREAPTHFRLMISRYVSMVQAVRGSQCSGTATVGFDGHHYLQTGRSDDPAMMELVAAASRILGISLANTYDSLIFAVILFGLVTGYSGFWHLYPDRRLHWVGVAVFLCLGIAEARISDEYVFQISPLISAIPWLLYFGLDRKPVALTLSAVLLAFCCSWCSLVRSGTIVICMTFLLTTFIARFRIQKPFLPLLLVALACVPSILFERSLIARRDFALARVGETATSVDSHPIWHTFYIGLGFIPNTEVPEYNDRVAGEKVRSVDPTVAYTSARYQSILRHEMWGIVKRRPMLVLCIFAAKVAVIGLLALVLLYPVSRLMFAEKTVLWVDAAFLAAIGMSAMNGVVAVPRASYLLTFLCLAFLYSCIKACRALYLGGSFSI